MADTGPETPREAYGSSYHSSLDKGGGHQKHQDILEQPLGSSYVGKDGKTDYWDEEKPSLEI